MRETIALFGGTFNPPHKGHLLIAKYVIANNLAKEVVFVPAKCSPHKLEAPLLNAKSRYAMVECMIEGEEGLAISDYEIINKHQASYTYYTLKAFQEAYSNKRIKFIMGTDNLCKLESWYKIQDIIENFEFIVFQRASDEKVDWRKLSSLFGSRLVEGIRSNVIDFDCDISSSKFCEAVKEGGDYSKLITSEVLTYIKENKLYE